MSPTTSDPPRAAHHGLRVVEHLVHRDAHGLLVAEHDHAQRVADEDQRDARLVDDARGRVVVGGEHRDALAVDAHLGDVGDGHAPLRLAGLGGRLRLIVALIVLPMMHPRPIRARRTECTTRSSSRSATWRFDISGHGSSGSPGTTIVTRLVSVPKPRSRLGDVVGDEQIDALALGLLARALERSGLGREADDHGLLPTPARASDAHASARMSSVGSSSRVSPSPVARDLAVGRVLRPEVGNGGGHDQRVGVR